MCARVGRCVQWIHASTMKVVNGPKEIGEEVLEEEEKEPAIWERGSGRNRRISQRSSKVAAAAAVVPYYLAACRWLVQRRHSLPRRWPVVFGDAATLTPGRTGTLLG